MNSQNSTDPTGLKLIFAGTPEFAARHLDALIKSHHQVIAVFTQPDRKAGRGRKLQASPVKQLALEHGIEVFQPASLKQAEDQEALLQLKADVMVVVAYGLILPVTVLEHPRLGCINVHASLLPRWRGAAPIQRSILAADAETGITFMQMDKGLDTGDMLSKLHCPITEQDTSASLHDQLAELGAQQISGLLDDLDANRLTAEKQSEETVCYAEKLSKQEGLIDWQLPATQINQTIRAFNPWPVAHTHVKDEVVRIWQSQPCSYQSDLPPGSLVAIENSEALIIATGSGCVALTKLQFPGGKPLRVDQILNAKRDKFVVGRLLSEPQSSENSTSQSEL